MAKNLPPVEKKKISVGNIIILVVLLIVVGVIVSYLFQDESTLGQCDESSDCGRYNVFYIKGQGYVCANDQSIADTSIKTKMLLFKYASKKAIKDAPSGCLCSANRCEVD